MDSVDYYPRDLDRARSFRSSRLGIPRRSRLDEHPGDAKGVKVRKSLEGSC